MAPHFLKKLWDAARWISLGVALIGVAIFLGWATDAAFVTRWSGTRIPMAPNTALCFALLGFSLASAPFRDSRAYARAFAWHSVAIVLFLAGITLFQAISGVNFAVDGWLLETPGRFGAVALGAMSPVTAATLCLAAGADAFLALPERFTVARKAAAFLSTAVFCVASVILLSYAYHTPLLYHRSVIPVALLTATCFFLWSTAALLMSGTGYWPIRPFVGDSVGAQLFRVFVPTLVLGLLIQGAVTQWADHATAVNPAVLVGFATFVALAAVTVLVSKLSHAIGGKIHRLQDELVQSQKLEGIGRLAGGIAHDFNNLLSVTLNFSDFIADRTAATDPRGGDLEEIRKAAKRGAGLTRQLLIFSRKEITKPEVVDMNALLQGMQKLLATAAGDGVELKFRFSEGLHKTEVDPAQFEMVLLNLAINARDAMPQGGRLTIETINAIVDEDYLGQDIGNVAGDHVLVSVSDTGCGMSKEVLSHLFEPFFTTKAKDKGTGLGLATTYGIVKQARGNIWVYSQPGLGTTFKIYLPATEKSLRAEALKPLAPKVLQGTETVFVVEDDPAVLLLVSRILTEYGYTVLTATHGPEAVKVAAEKKPHVDLLLSDLMLPHLSAKELVRYFRIQYPNLNVLHMSGYLGDVLTQHGIAEPGIPILQKPFNRETLLGYVRGVLDAQVKRVG